MAVAVITLDLAGCSHRGLVRDDNQDVAAVEPELQLALVADGMGGHDNGALASRTVADAFIAAFRRLGGVGVDLDAAVDNLRGSFHLASDTLGRHAITRGGPGSAGTTLVAAVVAHGRVMIGHIGDSRCYRWRGGTLTRLTHDHSFAAEVHKLGQSEQERAFAARVSHVLTRCIDGYIDAFADVTTARVQAGDVYLLCSDGLWGAVFEEAIEQVLAAAASAAEACAELVEAALAAGGPDNIGVAIVRLPRAGGA